MMENLRELYQEVILDHSKHPRNFGALDPCSHKAHGYNPLCGDTIDIYVDLTNEGVIREVKFDGKGCAISIASASLLTDIVKGKTLDDAHHLFDEFQAMVTGKNASLDAGEDTERLMVLAGIKEFPMRVKCATLSWHALQAALKGTTEATTE